MTRDEALTKVKKLLRLSKSTNVHEAAAALRQAQALMRQHALDQQEASDLGAVEEDGTAAARGSTPPFYAVYLCRQVSDAFGVKFIVQQLVMDGKHRFVFVGVDGRGQIAAYAFVVLLRQLERGKRKHISRVRVRKNRLARGDAFAVGWVQGVASVLSQWDVSEEEKLQIEAHIASVSSNTKVSVKRRQSKAVKENDFHQGMEEGRQARLNRGVAGHTQQAIEGPR